MAISPDMFRLIDKDEILPEQARPSVTYWQDAWRRLKKNPLAMASLFFILLMVLFAIFGPFFSPYTYSDQDFTQINQTPSRAHLLGTDYLGRDMLTRIMFGARISLSVGFVAAITTFIVGIFFGGISGLMGGWVDNLIMRFVDVMYSIPFLLWVIMLIVLLDPGGGKGVNLTSIFLALGIVYWLPMSRIVRGQILSLKEQEFILAANTIGASKTKILVQHLLPNAMGPIIVTATIAIPEAIFTESFLSFIGLGVSAPMASWGMLASDALTVLKSYPHVLVSPAVAICITLLAFNFIGDGLRDVLDPKMRK